MVRMETFDNEIPVFGQADDRTLNQIRVCARTADKVALGQGDLLLGILQDRVEGSELGVAVLELLQVALHIAVVDQARNQSRWFGETARSGWIGAVASATLASKEYHPSNSAAAPGPIPPTS